MFTDAQIYENRLKTVEHLKRPDLEKHTGEMADFNNPKARCCLGHMCDALGIPAKTYSEDEALVANKRYDTVYYQETSTYMPKWAVEALGLHDFRGCIPETPENTPMARHDRFGDPIEGLSHLNDATDTTPQQIGAYLETVIMGGMDTPWRALVLEPTGD